jgi:hypothetical protein
MESRYGGRPLSPGGRRLTQPARSSTGTLVYPSSYDPYRGPIQSSRELNSGPRTSAERVITPRVVPHYKPDSPPMRQPRDDYVVRPRRLALDPSSANTRTPLDSIAPSSPSRSRPIITTAIERPPSPLTKSSRARKDEDYYIQPASTSSRREHRRYNTIDGVDMSRLAIADRDVRDRPDRGGYRSSGIGGGRTGYNLNQPLVRQAPESDYDGYEYTDRREQMYRDTAPRPRPRPADDYNGGRRERPLSMTGLEGYPPSRTNLNRDAGPPPSTRGFGSVARSGSVRHDRARDESIPRDYVRNDYDAPQSRKLPRPQVALHHPAADGRAPYPDDVSDHYESRHHRPRKTTLDDGRSEPRLKDPYDDPYDRSSDDRSRPHHEKSHHRRHDDEDRDRRARDDPLRDKRDQRDGSGVNSLLLGAGAAGLAAAGAATEAARHKHHSKEPRDRDRDRERDRDRHYPPEKTRDDRGRVPTGRDTLDSNSHSTEASDEERRVRRRRRRERHDREAREAREAAEEDARRRAAELAPSKDHALKEQGSYERSSQAGSHDSEEQKQLTRRRRHHHSRSPGGDSYSDESSSDSEVETNRQRQVRVVTPSNEKPDPPVVKSILRQPREKFPEDPAPVREGVAPLKDAGKKGIPPNARWTKIDRKLVNPEALEQGNERYEERVDYVIVLRVLTKEEIEQYTAKTNEIRQRRGLITEGGHDS